jgi:fluoride ion exporter CrcB/FEX
MTLLLALGLVGGLGATARFLLDGAISERAGRQVPAGTFAVNISRGARARAGGRDGLAG